MGILNSWKRVEPRWLRESAICSFSNNIKLYKLQKKAVVAPLRAKKRALLAASNPKSAAITVMPCINLGQTSLPGKKKGVCSPPPTPKAPPLL